MAKIVTHNPQAFESFSFETLTQCISTIHSVDNGQSAGVTFAYRLDKIISHTVKRVVVEGLERYYTIPYEGGKIEAHFTSNMPCEIAKVRGSIYGNGVTLDKEAGGKYVIRFSAEKSTGTGRGWMKKTTKSD